MSLSLLSKLLSLFLLLESFPSLSRSLFLSLDGGRRWLQGGGWRPWWKQGGEGEASHSLFSPVSCCVFTWKEVQYASVSICKRNKDFFPPLSSLKPTAREAKWARVFSWLGPGPDKALNAHNLSLNQVEKLVKTPPHPIKWPAALGSFRVFKNPNLLPSKPSLAQHTTLRPKTLWS